MEFWNKVQSLFRKEQESPPEEVNDFYRKLREFHTDIDEDEDRFERVIRQFRDHG